MAGLEVVVRPVVFPNIRPRPRQSLPPPDDPEKGLAVIQGNPAGSGGMSSSWSASSSYSKPVESERRVDEARVYQMNDDDTVNKDNFVDLQVANRITTVEGGPEAGRPSIPGPIWSQVTDATKTTYYQRLKEFTNIEIRETDKIIKAQDQ
jgi:hypothetical protein